MAFNFLHVIPSQILNDMRLRRLAYHDPGHWKTNGSENCGQYAHVFLVEITWPNEQVYIMLD